MQATALDCNRCTSSFRNASLCSWCKSLKVWCENLSVLRQTVQCGVPLVSGFSGTCISKTSGAPVERPWSPHSPAKTRRTACDSLAALFFPRGPRPSISRYHHWSNATEVLGQKMGEWRDRGHTTLSGLAVAMRFRLFTKSEEMAVCHTSKTRQCRALPLVLWLCSC